MDDARFQLKRDAGIVSFDSTFRKGRGIGDPLQPKRRLRGVPETARRQRAVKREMFQLAIRDVSRSFIQELEKLGYKDLSLDTLEEMPRAIESLPGSSPTCGAWAMTISD